MREHFSLLLEKFKAKCKNEAKQSGDDVQDSELDVAIKKIWESGHKLSHKKQRV